ncbi:hypothetical protein QBC40DRAFT_24987 [Triangularia verruculosa]|uniref:Uncharacterized protein n=1 Tax=Triangularia verruculosa TaxID=2587418 RepID=A0AAN6X759_9PEZI|nr:hypothetical protein QBC40DRAFT_24987 [Triangularia verruculosa]
MISGNYISLGMLSRGRYVTHCPLTEIPPLSSTKSSTVSCFIHPITSPAKKSVMSSIQLHILPPLCQLPWYLVTKIPNSVRQETLLCVHHLYATPKMQKYHSPVCRPVLHGRRRGVRVSSAQIPNNTVPSLNHGPDLPTHRVSFRRSLAPKNQTWCKKRRVEGVSLLLDLIMQPHTPLRFDIDKCSSYHSDVIAADIQPQHNSPATQESRLLSVSGFLW